MRVTSKMTADSALFNIQRTRAQLDKLNEQIASGMNINRPGDDPISTRQLLDLDSKLKQGTQYRSNITKANIWQKVTETALGGMSTALRQVRQIASSINNGSNDPTIVANAVSQLSALKSQLVDMGNTQLGDQYIFGGFETRNPPFTAADNSFHGTPDSLNVEINSGTTLQLNVRGDQMLLGTGGAYGSIDILSEIDNLSNAISTNNSAAIRTAATNLDLGAGQINNAITDVASKVVRLDSMDKLLVNNKNTLETLTSSIQNVDYAKAATELSQQKTAFEAALSATAKVSSLSLLDYLK
jgi:flagellar hook-associated protein 3 FlgL